MITSFLRNLQGSLGLKASGLALRLSVSGFNVGFTFSSGHAARSHKRLPPHESR